MATVTSQPDESVLQLQSLYCCNSLSFNQERQVLRTCRSPQEDHSSFTHQIRDAPFSAISCPQANNSNYRHQVRDTPCIGHSNAYRPVRPALVRIFSTTSARTRRVINSQTNAPNHSHLVKIARANAPCNGG